MYTKNKVVVWAEFFFSKIMVILANETEHVREIKQVVAIARCDPLAPKVHLSLGSSKKNRKQTEAKIQKKKGWTRGLEGGGGSGSGGVAICASSRSFSSC